MLVNPKFHNYYLFCILHLNISLNVPYNHRPYTYTTKILMFMKIVLLLLGQILSTEDSKQ